MVYDLHPSFLMHNFLQPLFLRKHKGYFIQQKVLPSKVLRIIFTNTKNNLKQVWALTLKSLITFCLYVILVT